MDVVTDADFLRSILDDGDWHSQAEIIARSITERGHGLTVHSRAATLREHGYTVECEVRRNGNGRPLSFYRIVTLDEPAVAVGEDPPAGSSSVPTADGADLLAGSPSPLLEQTGTLVLFPDPVRGAYSGGEAA